MVGDFRMVDLSDVSERIRATGRHRSLLVGTHETAVLVASKGKMRLVAQSVEHVRVNLGQTTSQAATKFITLGLLQNFDSVVHKTLGKLHRVPERDCGALLDFLFFSFFRRKRTRRRNVIRQTGHHRVKDLFGCSLLLLGTIMVDNHNVSGLFVRHARRSVHHLIQYGRQTISRGRRGKWVHDPVQHGIAGHVIRHGAEGRHVPAAAFLYRTHGIYHERGHGRMSTIHVVA
jgi:hypothetical protein